MSKALRSILVGYGPILIVASLLALVPLRYGDTGSTMGIAVEGMTFAAYAIGFNIIFGNTGQLFLCIGALAGVGGFASAILADRAGFPMIVAMGVAALCSSLIGAFLSWISVRRALDTIFIGIVTLAFSLSFQNLILGAREWTGGETGIFLDSGKDTILRERIWPYYIFLALVVVYLVVFRLLQRSRAGWAFRALRDDQLAAELSGVDVAQYRVFAGALGSGMIGFAGALQAHTGRGFIGPSTYAFGDVDVRVLVMLIFGGLGSLIGPIVGALSLTVVDEFLVDYAQLRPMIYGSVIIVLFLGFRRGVVPAVADLLKRFGD